MNRVVLFLACAIASTSGDGAGEVINTLTGALGGAVKTVTDIPAKIPVVGNVVGNVAGGDLLKGVLEGGLSGVLGSGGSDPLGGILSGGLFGSLLGGEGGDGKKCDSPGMVAAHHINNSLLQLEKTLAVIGRMLGITEFWIKLIDRMVEACMKFSEIFVAVAKFYNIKDVVSFDAASWPKIYEVIETLMVKYAEVDRIIMHSKPGTPSFVSAFVNGSATEQVLNATGCTSDEMKQVAEAVLTGKLMDACPAPGIVPELLSKVEGLTGVKVAPEGQHAYDLALGKKKPTGLVAGLVGAQLGSIINHIG